MAKQALLDVLEQTIGKYVKDLDAENLNLGIWNGQVELNSLELNVDAVNAELDRQAEDRPNFSLPFRVNRGSFGSFQIDVPWSRLMSQPVVLRAHGLTVTVEAQERDNHHHNEAPDSTKSLDTDLKRQKKILEARIKSIFSANETRLRKRAMAELVDMETSKNTSGNSSFSSRLVRRIIENIQVEVNDVHISLESSDCAAGIVMESLTFFTTDARGKRSFVDRTSGDKGISNSFLFKALQIKGLGIYLDEDDNIFCSLTSVSEYSSNASKSPKGHSFILSPLSFEATLRQADSNVCIDYPKYLLSSKLPALSVMLSKSQLEFCAQIAHQVSSADGDMKPLFPEYRPLRRVTKETAKEWWKYAYRCVGRLSGRRGWRDFFMAFKRRKLYITLYKRDSHHEKCHWLEPLLPQELRELHGIENDRSVTIDGIMAWRNIADAHFEKEQEKYDATINAQKKKKTRARSFFFGTTTTETTPSTANPVDDQPPITLSPEEMKELETISVTQMKEDELSNDSKLCNIHFVLGSFRINLTSYELRPLAALNMGRVSSAFKANADGSFVFGLKVSSLDIRDTVTPQSLYPNVLCSLRKESTPGESEEDIFSLSMAKTKEGDQKLNVKLVSFQAVASPILLKEMKKFITITGGQQRRVKSSSRRNPMLAKSLTGSVDLFYDAIDGGDEAPLAISSPRGQNATEEAQSTAPSTFSNALIEAWKTKAAAKASWVADLDIRAPILVLPENCVDASANVLVLDLGHMRFRYGTIDESREIKTWFIRHPKFDGNEPIVDNGNITITNLTFMVTETNAWHRTVAAHGSSNSPLVSEAVVEPISIAFDFAIESVASADVPRGCAIGVVPSIVLRLSPTQASRVLNVYNAWTRLIKESTKNEAEKDLEDTDDNVDSEDSKREDQGGEVTTVPVSGDQTQAGGAAAYSVFYFSIWLQRLSVVVDFGDEGGVDAHLVSVDGSYSSLSDGGSVANLSMGWFWILDKFRRQYARRQRLVAHSSLPLAPHQFAIDEKYAILEELEKAGAFKERSSGATQQLANITYTSVGSNWRTTLEQDNRYAAPDPFVAGEEATRINAKFSSLYIHWNPQAVKTLTSMLGKFNAFLEASTSEPEDPLLIVAAGSKAKPKKLTARSRASRSSGRDGAGKDYGYFLINAEMKGFEITLNSARDDLPLFILTMSRAKVGVLSSEDSLCVSLALGDLRLATPEMGETQAGYRTLLGLAPSLNESLLCVQYWSGPEAMKGVTLVRSDIDKQCEAFTDVELSPMRMVYIHSQVMALVEYATEGILGALTAQAASSAVAAAADLANASDASKQYHVRATAFNFVLPQSARAVGHLSVQAGELSVVYRSFVDPLGGQASISLSDVSLCDSLGEMMQEENISVACEVKLPTLGVGTVEDQAMHVELAISSAAFLLSKSQFAQIMLSLDHNISDYDLYLRDPTGDDEMNDESEFALDRCDSDEVQLGPLTHGGVAEVIIPRRMVVTVKISVLSLELLRTPLQPLIRIAAVDANIVYLSLFDQEKRTTIVTLGNLVCDDQRQKAIQRQYQSLIYQVDRHAEKKDDKSVQDVFQVTYESMDNGDTNYELIIGCPRIVFVPDVVSELLDYLHVEGRASNQSDPPDVPAVATDNTDDTDCHVDDENVRIDEGNGGVEVSLHNRARDPTVARMSVAVTTSKCSVVLVDLAGDLSSIGSPRKSQPGSQVVENLVFEGRANSKLILDSSTVTGETTNMELNFHGDALEVFTAFGRDMRSPLQILEPAEFSVVMTRTPQRFELRAAALTPFNVSFSMRNYALISALISGLGLKGEASSDDEGQLSDQDARRIEQLATKLERGMDESVMSLRHRQSMSVSENFFRRDSDTGAKTNLTYAVSIKVTLPEANLVVINDLQGLDDALFRLTIATLVGGGELRKWLAPSPGLKPLTTFDCHVHTSIMADYFDSRTNLWKELLTKPWELALRGARGASKRFQSDRLSTTFDIESFPCCLSFSEQFIVSITAASRMWSIFSLATSSTASLLKEVNVGSDAHDSVAERGAAASAARNLITTLPYALENHYGLDVDFKLSGTRADLRTCKSGTMQYFRFEPPVKLGYGGQRLYGQDVLDEKSLQIFIGGTVVAIIDDLDGEVGKPRSAHIVILDQTECVLFTNVQQEGKTKVVHLSSSVNMTNMTSLPLQIALLRPKTSTWQDVGVCEPTTKSGGESAVSLQPTGTFNLQDGMLSKSSKSFGIRVEALEDFFSTWKKNAAVDIVMSVSPKLSEWHYENHAEVHGRLDFHAVRGIIHATETNSIKTKFDLVCRARTMERGRAADSFVVQVTAELCLVDDEHLFVDVFFEPRSVIVNTMPVPISVQTPMPHTHSSLCQHGSRESIHEVAPGSTIEVYTPGPSIAVNMRCADMPIAGTPMGWMETWIDLPLTPEFGLAEPLRCVFPFERNKNPSQLGGGCEFFVADGNTDLSSFFHDIAEGEMNKRASVAESFGMELFATSADQDFQRAFFITVCNYLVDHTGSVLIEQFLGLEGKQPSVPYSTFASALHHGRRVTLLPRSTILFQLLHLTMDGEEGIRRSLVFQIDNIAICEGGIASTQLPWDDNTQSGFFAYRRLVTTDQSEVHVIPEFIVFNGSDEHTIQVRQPGYADIVVPPGKIKPVWVKDRTMGLIMSLEYTDMKGFTPPMRVDNLGLRVAVLKSYQGYPLGSVALQTVIGAKDSKFVVKIGDIKRGSLESAGYSGDSIIDMRRDFLRFRIQASELEVTLKEYVAMQRVQAETQKPLRHIPMLRKKPLRTKSTPPAKQQKEKETPVCTFLLQRFTVDWQRVFKDELAADEKSLRKSVLISPERSQLSLVIHSILIKDERPETVYPVVFNSTSTASFLDLCVRIRGPLDSDLIKVDLVDMNLAHVKEVPQKMFLNTSEDFLWKLLDVADRIGSATAELASDGMQLKWDMEHGGYVVVVDNTDMGDESNYTPPRTGSIYDINKARVSPFTLILSFKRNPQASRYSNQNVKGGQIVKYFTQRLKFKIENADLTFSNYETSNLRGPSDRLVEVLQAVYLSRIKMKLVSIMAAATFQDWRSLASRADGDDTFVEGDLVRVTGNLAGKTANMVFKNTGKALGKGVTSVTNTVGNTFEEATGIVGARSFGAGVNSILSGVGGGLGDGLTGVGTGAGKAVQGFGRGTGQVIGGVTGGMLLVGKGIGQGVTQGDGKALVSGFSKGLTSVGTGVGQGVGTAVTGTADGVLSVGKGLFSGVRTIGKGIGGAFVGKKEDNSKGRRRSSTRSFSTGCACLSCSSFFP
ncbi:Putative vacuolar protein sorting-associated protein 13A [Seminavis robusta]|uniref:Vacuolar protein sorting-associated protein 13A n=1 Tax=Seminavis robusta TaxID=568900 RepID=A0A9N8D6B7_9STRA|nr:Putative vacuolar protein sorting-associated protein 13A [Seminavis robusta]|eukprot:Sro11_g008890.1 Putative vacuolar protein sorting-associated protein 13A (3278) ;mRNA; r:181604-192222